jgi:hypothetical protein
VLIRITDAGNWVDPATVHGVFVVPAAGAQPAKVSVVLARVTVDRVAASDEAATADADAIAKLVNEARTRGNPT